jgi:hypothetical protein
MDIEENQNRHLCVILEVEPKSPKALASLYEKRQLSEIPSPKIEQ